MAVSEELTAIRRTLRAMLRIWEMPTIPHPFRTGRTDGNSFISLLSPGSALPCVAERPGGSHWIVDERRFEMKLPTEMLLGDNLGYVFRVCFLLSRSAFTRLEGGGNFFGFTLVAGSQWSRPDLRRQRRGILISS